MTKSCALLNFDRLYVTSYDAIWKMDGKQIQVSVLLLLKLEKVQERALRFVYDDYTSSYINLLEKALVPSLQIRRIRIMALETYKIVNKLAPVCLHDLVNVKNSKYAFRYSNILDVPQVRTTRYGKKSFTFAAATLWNDLPNHFRTENSFNHFKSLIQSWNGSVCRCSACR